jgi:hypothetical protein
MATIALQRRTFCEGTLVGLPNVAVRNGAKKQQEPADAVAAGSITYTCCTRVNVTVAIYSIGVN